MGPMERFAADLEKESLREAADTFFGKRRRLEEDIELFTQKAEQLRQRGERIKGWVALLNYLLGGRERARGFWRVAGPEELADIQGQGAAPEADMPFFFAFTRFGRYWKTVQYLYELLAREIKLYTHGRYEAHPDIPGKKVATLSYAYLQKWLEELNSRIDNLNLYHKSSDVLQFAKKLDPWRMEKEKIAGTNFSYSLDQDLQMDKLDIHGLDLPVFPDLPELSRIRSEAKKQCKAIFSREKETIRDRLTRIQTQ